MSEFAETFRAAANNLSVRLEGVTSKEELAATLEDELRGLYHGLLVMFDGGTALADQGLIQIVDEDGNTFDRHLHELCFGYWPEASPQGSDVSDSER